jgi:excisionase family DNA binding protein
MAKPVSKKSEAETRPLSLIEITAKRTATVDETALIVGCGRTTVYEEINAGRLRARKIGRRTLILREDREAWLNSLPTIETAEAA